MVPHCRRSRAVRLGSAEKSPRRSGGSVRHFSKFCGGISSRRHHRGGGASGVHFANCAGAPNSVAVPIGAAAPTSGVAPSVDVLSTLDRGNMSNSDRSSRRRDRSILRKGRSQVILCLSRNSNCSEQAQEMLHRPHQWRQRAQWL